MGVWGPPSSMRWSPLQSLLSGASRHHKSIVACTRKLVEEVDSSGRSRFDRFADDFDHHDRRFIEDPAETYRQLREQCPVMRSERHGGFWLVSRYEDVRAASKDWERFTRRYQMCRQYPHRIRVRSRISRSK